MKPKAVRDVFFPADALADGVVLLSRHSIPFQHPNDCHGCLLWRIT